MRYSDYIALLVFRISKRIDKYEEKYLTENTNLSLLDWRLLVHVYKYQNSMLYEISEAMEVPLYEVVSSFIKLSKSELVEISENEITVQPTEYGSRMYHELMPHMSRRQEKILESLSSHEQEFLKIVAGKLLHNLEEIEKCD
jgi:DNA-binding MarR family transcriptional regulator